jgi:hypothetical protein
MFGITQPTGSHVPTLEAAARSVGDGLIIEHGAGLYSTPLLARLGCRVLCCESQEAWREWATWIYEGRARVVESIHTAYAQLRDASLVFIDGALEERSPLLSECIAARVPLIVAHDTHPRVRSYYGWTKQQFEAPGYTITHDDYRDKYRTTLWRR